MTFRIPVPLIILIVAALLLSLLIIFRPKTSLSSNPASSGLLSAQTRSDFMATETVQETIFGEVKRKKTVAETNPKFWEISDISSIKKTGFGTTIVFVDGSEELVTDFLLSQVPGDIAIRLEYQGGY